MALNLNQWVNYAKTKLESAVGRSNEELDRLEAERAAETADKPWLASDREAPTLDEARARIEWEAKHQADLAAAGSDAANSPVAPSPQDASAAAEAEQARLDLDERQKAAAERLDKIREELGVQAPPAPES